jgi:hypothetical protein
MAESQQITVRVDTRLIDRADALLEFVSEDTGRAAVRADVWREALIAGLRELERRRDKDRK